MGCLSNLIKDPSDIIPYMDILTEGFKHALRDSVAEVRSFASKALGNLCVKLGIENSEHFFSFLQETLQVENVISIERAGAAQAYSELICALGFEYFEK